MCMRADTFGLNLSSSCHLFAVAVLLNASVSMAAPIYWLWLHSCLGDISPGIRLLTNTGLDSIWCVKLAWRPWFHSFYTAPKRCVGVPFNAEVFLHLHRMYALHRSVLTLVQYCCSIITDYQFILRLVHLQHSAIFLHGKPLLKGYSSPCHTASVLMLVQRLTWSWNSDGLHLQDATQVSQQLLSLQLYLPWL